MARPKQNMAKGWELIASKIDMDTPSPLGRYLGCEHVSTSASLEKADHPFAHVFDKNIPDPAAKPATAAAVQDYTEYYPEEGVLVRHHVQPRKALYHLRSEEAKAMNLGKSRLTEVKSLSFPGLVEEVWDEHGQHRKREELWVGSTYLLSNDHTRASNTATGLPTSTCAPATFLRSGRSSLMHLARSGTVSASPRSSKSSSTPTMGRRVTKS